MLHLPLSLVTFFIALFFFHTSEVVLVFRFERASLSFRSLLLSTPYVFAMIFALLEYTLSLYLLFPASKSAFLHHLYWPGLFGLVIGEVLRKMAWLTARVSFSHDIRLQRMPAHKLITNGIYSWTRHPAYLGWFLWAISTQILLANPISFIIFTFASWKFFSERIPFEEIYLVHFFGESYTQYRAVTPTLIPGIP